MPVTPADRGAGPASNSPLIIADPGDSGFVVMANRLDAPQFGCALQLSGDGGWSWVTAQPLKALPSGADTCYAPEVAFGPGGRLYFLFVGLAGAGNRPMGVFVTSSDDRGRTFGPARPVLGPLKFGVRMAVDRSVGRFGRMHLVWIDTASDPLLGGFGPGSNPILTSYSDDGGVTFSTPEAVSSTGRPRVVAPALALGPDHAVHVGYYDLGADARDYQGLEGPVWDGTWSVVVRTSRDGGLSFGAEEVVDDGVVPSERVMLVFTMPPPGLVAVGKGRCAAWTDARHGDADALLRCSPAVDQPWGPLRRVNDDAVGNGKDQYQPRLGAAPGGRLDVVFYDRRLDVGNRLNRVATSSSGDGGRTFTANVALSQEDSNTRLGPQYAVASAKDKVEFGSRIGLLSTDSGLVAAWTDTRNGEFGKSSQDIFATTLRLGGDGWPLAPVAAGAAGMLGLLVLAGVLRRRRAPPAAALAAVALLAGCSLPSQAAPWPPRPTVVEVTMTDFRFAYQARIPAGRVVFRVRNAGSIDHELQFFSLTEDIPPIDAQLRGSERRIIPPLGGVPHRNPGGTGTFAVDLRPGQRYALICFLQEGGSHALKGMSSEFRAAS